MEIPSISSKNKIFNIRKVKNQRKWNKEEDMLLIQLVEKYQQKNWRKVSCHFGNKTSLQCFSRYKRIRPGIRKGKWKKEEDEMIIKLIEKYGTSWAKISKEIKTRNGKQIRDRYLNVLNPSLNRTTFTQEDDNYIIHLYNKYGPKWSFIVQFFTNRTADMIKNRFHSSIKKKLSNDSNMSTRMTSFDDVIPNTNISLHSDLIFLSEQENNSIEPIILNKEAEQETITNNDSLDLFNDDEYFNF